MVVDGVFANVDLFTKNPIILFCFAKSEIAFGYTRHSTVLLCKTVECRVYLEAMKHFSKLYSIQTTGLSTQIINIETDITRTGNKNSFNIVGLPDKAVEEARDRINAAIKNSGFSSPKTGAGKTVISLAPADVKKEGAFFDLGMALGYLLADGKITFNTDKKIFLGELSLDGKLRAIKGVLLLAQGAQKQGFKEIYVPKENAREAALIKDIDVYAVSSFSELVEHLNISPKNKTAGEGSVAVKIKVQENTQIKNDSVKTPIDFADIRGQENAKKALEIAAAGGHNIAMYGPPGTGKTMLARAFVGILPTLSYEEVLEVTGIHSLAGTLEGDLITKPPFRSPHHTSSYVSIVGGGAVPKPGEITLAHKGALFMDEFPEFEKRVLESLRQPLEDRVINISRVKGNESFPANFILIAAMNPCPCGYFASNKKTCTCTQSQLNNYKRKLSGPIMDRIDLWVHVGELEYEKLSTKNEDERQSESEKIRKKISEARLIQNERLKICGLSTNGEMGAREIEKFAMLEKEATQTLLSAAKNTNLSPRSYHKVIKVARTIADLDKSKYISDKHILLALNYKPEKLPTK